MRIKSHPAIGTAALMGRSFGATVYRTLHMRNDGRHGVVEEKDSHADEEGGLKLFQEGSAGGS